ncbi:DUF1254 domain-containing protein [Caulobacter sp. UNC358MFTsu5.1]|uniref:DUF1254 domain-containing protein n=1 Tax=Caulobacter sp. UNC358MFTsu5.1 TaxID=1449049 RepID=UPI0006923026|nr:DUF1254 domain-containing protein [Caulobacter sp. UNC358MFTsu5.1]
MTAAAPDLQALRAAARTAWLYALPLIELASTRARSLAQGLPLNTFGHRATLADHRARAVTTPNNDTLYSTAQVDLSRGPVSIAIPRTADRYFSLALMDAYTNNFAVLGTRTTGGDFAVFTLVGPNDAATGPNVVRAPTPQVWALARVLVDGPDDLEAAKAIQGRLAIQGPAADPPGGLVDRGASWELYFASAAKLMALNPPPVTDWAVLARMEPLGLGDFDPARFTPAQAAAIAAGVEEARREVRREDLGGRLLVDGWSYPPSRLGDFDQAYDLRAAVALAALAALPPAEAMYMRSVGDLPGGMLDGARNWRLHFAAGALPPVDAFWSLSLYEASGDGQFFFADNRLGRYAIGDRTPGLVRNRDGSLDIWIANAPPNAERQANWLPAPSAPFALFMRAYLPRPELLDGRYRLPPIEPAGQARAKRPERRS